MSEPSEVPDAERHNNTLRYQRELFARIPDSARSALDVGCGEGIAARELAARGLNVAAIDLDEPSLVRARAQSTAGINYVSGDVMTATLAPVDVVYAGAVLHHLELAAGLERLRALVKPGGRLLIVGLAATSMPWDAPRDLAAMVADGISKVRRPTWEHGAPTVWPPTHTYADVKREVERTLPGASFRRRLFWRYTVEWVRPTED